jgi:hypothetical protein
VRCVNSHEGLTCYSDTDKGGLQRDSEDNDVDYEQGAPHLRTEYACDKGATN